MDPWQVLGVSPDASKDDIKTAYRKLARDHHPDLGGDPNRFIEIQKAYEQLTNPQPQSNPFTQQHPFGADPLSEIFRNFSAHFGGGFRSQARNANFQVSVEITVAESITGCDRTIQIIDNGVVKNLDLKIPAGSQPGDTVKYAGMGSNSRTDVPSGDLFVHINVNQLADYEWQMGNLICTRTVSAWQAMLGTSITVTDPFGASISVTVPAGTQPNTILRVQGRGGYNRMSHQRADILVKIAITIPDITPEQKQFIQTWI